MRQKGKRQEASTPPQPNVMPCILMVVLMKRHETRDRRRHETGGDRRRQEKDLSLPLGFFGGKKGRKS